MFLDRIVTQTQLDLVQRKQEVPQQELERLAAQQAPARDMHAALAGYERVKLIAEVKRASPSKGMLAPDLDPVETARTYETNGAAVISVLTEPHFFLGAPEYLIAIKGAVSIPVLRKDFIVDPYQVYEARAWGADGILLICAILDDDQLRSLYRLARSLGMHVLVETHSRAEAQRALQAGAEIIGVNSRDLTTFQMNPYLIREIRQELPDDRVIVAESGIHTQADARRLARYDVQAMLVGESLVVSNDIAGQMRMLLQGANESIQVKICGLREPEHVNAAIEAGADLLGFIFHEPSHRYIQPQRVVELLRVSERYVQANEKVALPDLVGVFVNKDADYINEVAELVGLHYVQVHGNESADFYQKIRRPVIKGLQLKESADITLVDEYAATAWRLLLDTPTVDWGGSGRVGNWELAREAARRQKIFLAGGLTPGNVAQAIEAVHPWGVDVSSGIETDKHKDVAKIAAFLASVRQASSSRDTLAIP